MPAWASARPAPHDRPARRRSRHGASAGQRRAPTRAAHPADRGRRGRRRADPRAADRHLRHSPGARMGASWDAASAVGEARHDIYLVDYRLGDRNGLELVRAAIEGRGRALHRADRTGQPRDRPRGDARRRLRLSGQVRDDRAAARAGDPLRDRAPSRRAAAGRARPVRSADRSRQPGPVPRLPAQDPGARRAPPPARGGHAARPRPLQDRQRHLRPRGGRSAAQADRPAPAVIGQRERPGRAARRRRVHRGDGQRQRPRGDRRLRQPAPGRGAAAGPPRRLRGGDQRQHRHLGLPDRRRQHRRAAGERGRRDVPRQGAGRRPLPLLHHGDAGAGGARLEVENGLRGAVARRSSACTTSPRWRCAPARSWAWRRCCAGSIRGAVWCRPPSSSRWPRRPG